MNFEDAVNAERERQHSAADERARQEVTVAEQQKAGRAELRRLIEDAHALLKREGGMRAFSTSVTVKRPLFGGPKHVALVAPVGFALAGGSYILHDDGRLMTSDNRANTNFGWDHKAEAAAVAAVRAQHSKAILLRVGSEFLWDMTRPSGWDDQFFVEKGQLVFGSSETYQPPKAADVIARWVAAALIH